MTTTKERWDAIFSKGQIFITISDGDLDAILVRVGQSKTALDLACGAGDLVVKLARRGIATTGADISPVALGITRDALVGAGVDAKLIEADFNSLSIATDLAGPYDIIFMRAAFAFVKDRDVFLNEVKKILRPGGAFVCILTGLLPDGVYDDRQRKISLPKDELEAALHRSFPSAELLLEDTTVQADWPLLTYLCKMEVGI